MSITFNILNLHSLPNHAQPCPTMPNPTCTAKAKSSVDSLSWSCSTKRCRALVMPHRKLQGM